MELPREARLLRIFIGESDRWEHQPLYEAIVLAARKAGVAGATVFRSPMGYGASSTFHTAKILQLSFDLPIVIECIDTQEKLDAFLPTLQSMMSGGLITTQPVEVLHHQSKPQS